MTTVDTAPSFSSAEAVQIVRDLYGITAEAEALPSERDQNFRILGGPAVRILKIANPAEAADRLSLENDVMLHLNKDRVDPVSPRPLESRRGRLIETVIDGAGGQFSVRLLTYLEGTLLAEAAPHSPELLYDLGRFTGELTQALVSCPVRREPDDFIWDIRNGMTAVTDCRQSIQDQDLQGLLDLFLDVYCLEAEPVLDRLETGLIHNDGNDRNMIIAPPSGSAPDFGSRRVAGIIDFGDMVNSFRLADLAVVCAYAMLHKDRPLDAASDIVRGYHEVRRLKPEELQALYPMICMRLIMSVSIAARQKNMNPANEYLTVSEQPVCDLLGRLASVPAPLARAVFRDACGLRPVEQEERITDWLRLHSDEIGPVIEGGLGRDDYTVFDLSIGSRLISDPDMLLDVPELTRLLFSRIDRQGCRAGIGRYNEARLVYTAGQFRETDGELDETRTIHLGIDLFMVPSTPVLAPLDGTVYSIAHNLEPLDYGPTVILEHDAGEGGTFYTLYGHLAEDCLDTLQEGMKVRRGDRIAAIGNFPVNGNWPPHLHFQIMTDMLGMRGNFPGVAARSSRRVWLSICPDPNLILKLDPEGLTDGEPSSKEIESLRRAHVAPSLSLSYTHRLQAVRGYMQYLYDETGRKYLDSVNNVPHVGHSHPRVVQAAAAQLAVLNTNTRYLHGNLVRYAARLTAALPPDLSVCFIVNSGSEANDLALRLARHYTGARDIIALEGAYHGHLTSLIEISSYKYDGPGGKGAPVYSHKAVMPDLYRGQWRYGDPDAGENYASDIGRILQEMEAAGRKPAAFIAEPLMGCGGQIVLPEGYLAHAFRQVRAAGGVCIADEVQIGFGRVGTHFWGFETQGAVPDIVTLGKPIGNGFPLAAVVTTPEIAADFADGMEYFNTFGGNPAACAAGMAVLDVIEEEHLQQNALKVGGLLMAALRELQKDHPLIGDVRGMGLYIGAELVLDPESRTPAPLHAAYIAERMREEGVLISTDGPDHNVLKIKPPIIYTGNNADLLVETLSRILGEDAVRV